MCSIQVSLLIDLSDRSLTSRASSTSSAVASTCKGQVVPFAPYRRVKFPKGSSKEPLVVVCTLIADPSGPAMSSLKTYSFQQETQKGTAYEC